MLVRRRNRQARSGANGSRLQSPIACIAIAPLMAHACTAHGACMHRSWRMHAPWRMHASLMAHACTEHGACMHRSSVSAYPPIARTVCYRRPPRAPLIACPAHYTHQVLQKTTAPLETLDLSRTGMTSVGAKLVAQLLIADGETPLPLRRLILHGNSIGPDGFAAVGQAIRHARCGLETFVVSTHTRSGPPNADPRVLILTLTRTRGQGHPTQTPVS